MTSPEIRVQKGKELSRYTTHLTDPLNTFKKPSSSLLYLYSPMNFFRNLSLFFLSNLVRTRGARPLRSLMTPRRMRATALLAVRSIAMSILVFFFVSSHLDLLKLSKDLISVLNSNKRRRWRGGS